MDKLDHRSAPRKTIVPWYDSEAVCFGMIVLMVFIFSFAYIGFGVTRNFLTYENHYWIPVALMIASGGIILSTTFRLVRRYISRRF